MIKNIFYIFFLLSLFSTNILISQISTWAYSLSGLDEEQIVCLKETNDGNYIIGANTNSFELNNWDILITKISPMGEILWQKTYEILGYDKLYSIETCLDGGILIGGISYYLEYSGSCGFLIKLDENGDIIWQKAFPVDRTNYMVITAIEELEDGGIILGTDSSFGCIFIKLDCNGNILFSKKIEGIPSSYTKKVMEIEGGKISAIINFSSNQNSTESALLILNNNFDIISQKIYSWQYYNNFEDFAYTENGEFLISGLIYDHENIRYYGLVCKIDSFGNIIWQKSYQLKQVSFFYSINKTADGNFLITGSTKDDFFDKNSDLFILKIDPYGNPLMAKIFGGKSYDRGEDALATSDGGILVSGLTYSFGPAKPNLLILKLDETGNTENCQLIDSAVNFVDKTIFALDSYCYSISYSLSQTDIETIKKNVNLIKEDLCIQENCSFISIYPTILKNGIKNSYYSQSFLVSGGQGPYEFSIIKGSLPPGLNMSLKGEISGYSEEIGIYGFKVQVKDFNGCTKIYNFKIKIFNPKNKYEFSKIYGGNGFELPFEAEETVDGGFVIGGETHSYNNNYDILILKLQNNGETEWAKIYGGSNTDYASSIKQTMDLGYIVAGTSYSFGYYKDFWILKLDKNGDIIWQKIFGSYEGDGAREVLQAVDGYYIAVGIYGYYSEDSSILVLKIDENGNILREKIFGDLYLDDIRSVFETSDGNFLILAYSDDEGMDHPDLWVLKLDEYLDPVWIKKFTGYYYDWLGSAIETSDGNYMIAGLSSAYGRVLIKMNKDGDIIWIKRYYINIFNLANLPDGNILVSGYYYGSVLMVCNLDGEILWQMSYDPTIYGAKATSDGGIFTYGWNFFLRENEYDFWLLKLDENGTISNCDVSLPYEGTSEIINLPFQDDFNFGYSPNYSHFISTDISPQNVSVEPFDICQFYDQCLEDLGDVNKNGQITSMDSSLILQYVVDSIDLVGEERCRGDVNLNKKLTSMDASYILQCTVGNCENLPQEFLSSCSSHSNCR